MTRTEREKFLAELHVGVIAVERPDRAPLAVPIWYGYEPGGEVVLWTDAGTLKERLIRAAGRFSITAQVEQPPYRYVTAEGSVTAIDAASPEVVRAIAVRYLGPEEGAAFAEQNLGPDSVVIRMRPERWLSTDYSKQ
ncbi:pyridoxamine 5'-phosphate oxidase [Nocardia sp. 852002-20019_SCH5090214]|uniref:Pyridoxamine 5'-phosphate oxidase n=2 Tax=Nocardiaceae TaxID=85025 RepID=A0A2S6AAF4_9NOCA|nr:pyridoxamine 5'-phosphate oxidase [Nocardia sp. 852002-51101_SCH5132738]OBA45466.1 pyridoxamine 5'-phosphate oxidase [Nocardia sp. 852002-20019_SCH5090214]OBB45661.1 pyridoxamine 5'-phosphate oxidase [Nocardia sp. 852002-51244_SCH5132740]OBF71756.1 pyridoxamine 5'-phosphate oxidase [Mycobacterium sp. 852002-51759_SCH5129042]PPI97071.1 pyridoxamine 5'-phosphate oxidase [Nocardia nova]